MNDENPSRLVRQRRIKHDWKKNVWKQNVCQLTPCIRRSQSVDDHHWLDEHTTLTPVQWEKKKIENNRRRQTTISLFFSKINKWSCTSSTWWCRCYIHAGIFIHSFIHQDRWCSVYWLVYLFKLMLGRTAVRWIQSSLTCTNVCSKLKSGWRRRKSNDFERSNISCRRECFSHTWEYLLDIVSKTY